MPTIRPSRSLKHAGFALAALVVAAGVTLPAGTAEADHRRGKIVLVAHTGERVEVPANYSGPRPHLFRDRSRGWHARNHEEAHFWYHTLVSDNHRFLRGPMRFQRSAHHWYVEREFQGRPRHVRRHGPRHDHFDGHRGGRHRGHHGDRHAVDHPDPHHRSASSGRHGGAHRRNCNINAGTLLGAAAGGFAGSHIGSGSGRLAATAAGTFLGAAIGTQAGC